LPTIHREEGFRFGFYSADRVKEPPHVHAVGSGGSAKVWLTPVRLAEASGLSDSELRTVLRIVSDHQAEMLEAWERYGPEE
jgi:hypothetical protein